VADKETDMSFVSRGFRGRRRGADANPARVPPGQSVTRDFPVLSAGPTPPLDRWTFSIENGGVLRTWSGRPAAATVADQEAGVQGAIGSSI
jgi:hypothetical protein